MRSSPSASGPLVSGCGDVALCGLFLALSLLAGIFVVTVLLVASSPLVSMFPPDSGAHEIVLGISLMWGVVTGCVAANADRSAFLLTNVANKSGALSDYALVGGADFAKHVGDFRGA